MSSSIVQAFLPYVLTLVVYVFCVHQLYLKYTNDEPFTAVLGLCGLCPLVGIFSRTMTHGFSWTFVGYFVTIMWLVGGVLAGCIVLYHIYKESWKH